MNLSDIIRESVDYLSGVTITVDSACGTVCITDDEGILHDIFLQGEGGYGFIGKAEELWNDTGDTTITECWYFLARDYVDCIWN